MKSFNVYCMLLVGFSCGSCDGSQSYNNWSPLECEGEWLRLDDAESQSISLPIREYVGRARESGRLSFQPVPRIESYEFDLPVLHLNIDDVNWQDAEVFVPEASVDACHGVVDVAVPVVLMVEWPMFQSDVVEAQTVLHSVGRGAERHVGFDASVRGPLSVEGIETVEAVLAERREGSELMEEEDISLTLNTADQWFDPSVDPGAYHSGFGVNVMHLTPSGWESFAFLFDGELEELGSP